MSARAVLNALREAVGPEEAKRLLAAASACFAVGDRVNVFDKSGRYAGQGTVDCGYGMFEVESEDGAYVDRDGVRFNYCYGYIVQVDGASERAFVPSRGLARDDNKPSYLRLVAANGRPVQNDHRRLAVG